MTSKAVDDRIMIAGTVLSVLEMHQSEVIGPLRQRLFDPNETSPFSIESLLAVHRDLIERARDAMIAADDEVNMEVEDDQQYRTARDEAAANLLGALRDARGLLEAAYGESILKAYHLSATPPTAPDMFQEYADKVIHALRTRPLTEVSPYGFDLDLAPIADRIETAVVPLVTALADVRREAREIREALDARNEAMAHFDETYGAVADAIHAYFILAGRPDLAALLR